MSFSVGLVQLSFLGLIIGLPLCDLLVNLLLLLLQGSCPVALL